MASSLRLEGFGLKADDEGSSARFGATEGPQEFCFGQRGSEPCAGT